MLSLLDVKISLGIIMTGLLTILLCIFWTLVTTAASIPNSNDTMSWRDAVEFCAKDKKILRKGRPGLSEVLSERFWTRIYEKEHFVYLIGCFNPSQMKTTSATNMTEAECVTCLNHHPFMFAKSVNNNWCSCVYDALPDPPGRCDHNEHIFVFGTNDGYQNRKYGVQLKCLKNKTILIQRESHKKRELFCNNTVIPWKFTWQNAIERCKKKSGKLKDFKFDDICKANFTKAWFGFGTVTSEEEYMKHSDLLEPKRCQSCAGLCQFENCSEHRKPKCESETKSTSVNVMYTRSMRPLHTLTTSGGRTTTGDTKMNIKMVLIYTASPLLAAILIVLCVLYMRSKRKRRRKEDLSRQPVREQLYELADNSQLEKTVNDQGRADGGLSAEDSVNPGSGQREDIYNHLRERSVDPSQEGEEGVYSRCIGGDDDKTTYDVTCRNKLQFPTRDSVYNHVILFDSSTK